MKTLLVISSAPVSVSGETVTMDDKFQSGMTLYCDSWDGPVVVCAPMTEAAIPFSSEFGIGDLPFALKMLPSNRSLTDEDVREADVILCSGDSFDHFHLAEICRAMQLPLFYMIENTLQTRQQIAFLDRQRSLVRRLRTWLWLAAKERARKKAFRLAAGIQANGYPAFGAYRGLNRNAILYLDSRMGRNGLADDADQQARFRHLEAGGAIRLVHSGRLEPLKGSLDLVALCQELSRLNVRFELDIFGDGTLEAPLRSKFEQLGLTDQVRLHGSVGFQAELVPHMRRKSDIFISCHRQGDPSCTYLEAMGCGTPIVGYRNAMWTEMQTQSNGGWAGPMARPAVMASILKQLDTNRDEILVASKAALSFARAHTFDAEFAKRISHLAGRYPLA